jgi:hypothetical protein
MRLDPTGTCCWLLLDASKLISLPGNARSGFAPSEFTSDHCHDHASNTSVSA